MICAIQVYLRGQNRIRTCTAQEETPLSWLDPIVLTLTLPDHNVRLSELSSNNVTSISYLVFTFCIILSYRREVANIVLSLSVIKTGFEPVIPRV